jgi:tetratricopeptide (TPR) repeat protein
VDEAVAIVDKDTPAFDTNTPVWTKAYVRALRRGRVLDMAGRAEQAHAEYDAALREVDERLKQLSTPHGPAGLRLSKARVDLLILTGRTQEAIAVADQALAAEPDNVPLLTVRCQARLKAPVELAKARQDCDAARRNDPANRLALYTSGLVSLKLNDWNRALGEFQTVIKESPRTPGALFGSGIAKLRRGEKTDGGADIELARSLSPDVDAEFVEMGLKP